MILSMKKILKVSIHVTVGKSLEKNWCIWITWMQLLQSVVHRTMTCLPCSVTYMCIWGFVLFLKFWKCTGSSCWFIYDTDFEFQLPLNFVADFSFFWKDLIANRKKLSELYKECGDLIDLVDTFYGHPSWRTPSVNCMYQHCRHYKFRI